MPIPKRVQPNNHLPAKEQAIANRKAEGLRRYSEASNKIRIEAETLYREGKFLCSEAVFTTVNDHLGQPADARMVKMASGFPVGMGMAGCLCGALSGGVMALGLSHGRERAGAKMNKDMFPLSAELHDRFLRRNKVACCRKLIKHMKFGSKEHMRQCIRFTGEVAADVIDLIENGITLVDITDQPEAIPANPADCGGCEPKRAARANAGYPSKITKAWANSLSSLKLMWSRVMPRSRCNRNASP